MTDPNRTPDDEERPDDVEGAASDVPQEGSPEGADSAAPPESDLSPLEAAQASVAQLEDRLRRTEAGFLNETKRIRKNADAQGRFAIERVVLDLLPVIDALHSARRNLSDDEAGRAHADGIDLIERLMTDALARHGIERIEAQGLPFDPAFHEAMMAVEDDAYPPQTARDEMRAGYTLHGRVVRPAQVIVTKAAAAPTGGADEEA